MSEDEALIQQASLLQQQGRVEEIVPVLQRLVRLRPDIIAAHAILGDALLALGRRDEALAAFDAALALDPANAELLNRRGVALIQLDRPAEAEGAFRAVLAADPHNAGVMVNLGIILHQQGRSGEALAMMEQAARLAPDQPAALINLGDLLRSLGRHEEAVVPYTQALAIGPDAVFALNARGYSLKEAGRLDQALADFDRVLALEPSHAGSRLNRALVLLAQGKLAEAWPLYEARWEGALAAEYGALPRPVWLGEEEVGGKTVLLRPEQGLGDVIQMARYGPLLAARGAKVVLAAPAVLVDLLRSLESVTEVAAEDGPLPAFDLCIPMMSLPLAFGTTIETIPGAPYLKAPADRAQAFAERLGPASRLRVGVSWASGARPDQAQLSATNARRDTPLEALRPLAEHVQLISLQKGLPAESTLKGLDWGGAEPLDLSDELHDFADTAALIENLDLVISVDTAVAHLAGALGKPVWIALRRGACWRWLTERGDSPWYPSARLFRQGAAGDWAPVIARMKEALGALV